MAHSVRLLGKSEMPACTLCAMLYAPCDRASYDLIQFDGMAKKNSGGAGKSNELVEPGIHFISESIFS
jgi:hypothetical protein